VVALVTSGVPWDIVKGMDRVERMAWLIAIGERNGGEFNYRTWQWREK